MEIYMLWKLNEKGLIGMKTANPSSVTRFILKFYAA
jgi:hypothetical protein